MKQFVHRTALVFGAISFFTMAAVAQLTNVSGEVAASDTASHKVTMKNDAGAAITVLTDEKTALLRVPAGESSLANAAKIEFADIHTGDKVLARGTYNADKSQLTTVRLVVLSKSDIEAKHQQDLDDWRKRGIFGMVKSVDPQSKKIELEMKVGGVVTPITVDSINSGFMRYAPTSLAFADAKPSTLTDIKPGDQLRALGSKSPDGKIYTAEKVISGSFQTIGVTITEVDVANNIIHGTTLDKKKPITLLITKDSVMHRIPPQMALGMARRLAAQDPDSAPAPAGTGGAQPANGNRPAGSGDTQRPAGAPGQGGPGGPGGAGRGNFDIPQMIDMLPNIPLADLKAGDILAVASSASGDPSNVTAIKVVAGMDGVINALTAAMGRRPQNTLSSGLPSGFDFGGIQP